MSVDCKTVWANLITGDIRGAPVSSSWQQLRPGCEQPSSSPGAAAVANKVEGKRLMR